MDTFQQILLGTVLLPFSSLVHVGTIAWSIPFIGKLAGLISPKKRPWFRIVALLAFSVFVLVFAHTIQVWTWAVVILEIT